MLKTRSLALLLLALAFIWFLPLGLRHLVPNDEGRYAEMAREMFTTGDWITPRYNGYKYFEKPPLEIWANALTFTLFGIGDWQARLYTALAGFAGVLLLGYTASQLFDRLTGFYAAVILATCPFWNLMGHYNTLDMGLAFWMEGALCALLLAQRPSISISMRNLWMCLSWSAVGLAVLSKGLVGLILPGTVLILYSLIARDTKIWQRLSLLRGVPLFALITAPWFVLVQIRNPDFFHFFFVVQQFQRYLTPEQHRPGPIWYFIPVLLVGFLPWLSMSLGSFRTSLRTERAPNGFSPVIMLIVWAVFIFIFFSVSQSKLLSYILPVAPAIAVLLALGARNITAMQLQRHLYVYSALLLSGLLASTYLGKLNSADTPNALYREFQIWVTVAIVVGLTLTGVAFARLRSHAVDNVGAVLAFGAGWLLLCTIAGNGYEVIGSARAGIPLVPSVKAAMAALPKNTPFYSITKLDHTLPYYLGHTMIMVQGADELQFGVNAEPQKWIPTIDQWIRRWKSEAYGLALMGPDRYADLLAMHVPMTVVARDTRRVIVEKPLASQPQSSDSSSVPIVSRPVVDHREGSDNKQ